MGFLSRFEGKMEDTMEGVAGRMSDAPISPVQISKKAEKAMRREKMVGAGKQYAPTLYTVLVNVDDDRRLFGMYPTLAGEIETYLSAKAIDNGLVMDGQPLVRFIADESLRHGKFDIVAEPVAAPIIAQLRQEEMERYGMIQNQPYGRNAYDQPAAATPRQAAAPAPVADVPHDPYAPNDVPYLMEDIPMESAYAAQPVAAAGVAAAGAAAAGAAAAGAAVAGTAAPATAAPTIAMPSARLLDQKGGRVYTLHGSRIMVGRGADCDITIPDINCSRHHALFTQEAHGVWVIADQGSTNGTVINGRTINVPEPLYEGTQITLGLTTLIFTMV